MFIFSYQSDSLIKINNEKRGDQKSKWSKIELFEKSVEKRSLESNFKKIKVIRY